MVKTKTFTFPYEIKMTVFHGQILVRLNSHQFELPCVFSKKDNTPFLLGRAGILDKFSIIFDAKRKAAILKPVKPTK